MTRTYAALIPLVLSTGACTSSSFMNRGDAGFETSINAHALAKTVQVVTRDGSHIKARGLRVEGDSVSFLGELPHPLQSADPPKVFRMAADEVLQVHFISHGGGAVEGLYRGVIGGLVTGFLFGAAAAHEPCGGYFDLTCGSSMSVGKGMAIVFAIPGGLLGVIGGAAIGHRFQYDFTPKPPAR